MGSLRWRRQARPSAGPMWGQLLSPQPIAGPSSPPTQPAQNHAVGCLAACCNHLNPSNGRQPRRWHPAACRRRLPPPRAASRPVAAAASPCQPSPSSCSLPSSPAAPLAGPAHILLMPLNLHRQAADIDGVHLVGQAVAGVVHQGVLVPLEAPARHLIPLRPERQVVGDENEPAGREGQFRHSSLGARPLPP